MDMNQESKQGHKINNRIQLFMNYLMLFTAPIWIVPALVYKVDAEDMLDVFYYGRKSIAKEVK